MSSYNSQINPMSTVYPPQNPASARKHLVGMTLFGGLTGMTAYYLPVQKDTFVNKAFELTKAEADEQISTLKTVAEEVDKAKVSTKSKMILQDMGLSEDVTAITTKCSEIDKSVTDSVAVKDLKNSFSQNFTSYKKDCSLMDNTCAEAFKAIKWSRFKWGIGIGSAIGLTMALLSGKD